MKSPVVLAVVKRNGDKVIKPIEELDGERVCDGCNKRSIACSNGLAEVEAAVVNSSRGSSDQHDHYQDNRIALAQKTLTLAIGKIKDFTSIDH